MKKMRLKKKEQVFNIFKYVISYIGVALFSFFLICIVSLYQIILRMQNEEHRLISERMYTIVEDMDSQFNSMRIVASKIANNRAFYSSEFIQDKYQEFETVRLFESLFNNQVVSSYAFLKYENYDRIITSDGSTIPISVYFKNFIGQESDQLIALTDDLCKEHRVSLFIKRVEEGINFVFFPLRAYENGRGENRVLVLVVTDKDVQKRLELLTGSFSENIVLSYDDQIFYGNNNDDEKSVIFSASEHVTCIYEAIDNSGFWSIQILSVGEWIIVLSSCVVVLLLAIYIAWKSYKPIRIILKQVDELLVDQKNKQERLSNQYNILRENMIRLIIKGGYVESMKRYSEILNLNLSGQIYYLLRCKFINYPIDMEGFVLELEELSDDEMHLYSAWDRGNVLKILISLSEDVQIEEVCELIKELLEANSLQYEMSIKDGVYKLDEISDSGDWIELGKETIMLVDKWDLDGVGSVENERDLNEINIQNEKESKIVADALRFVGENYNIYDLNLGFVAQEMNLSVSNLSRIIKRHTGICYKDHLLKIRIEAAKELLQNSDFTVAEICEKVGYVNVSNFIKIFRNTEGVTPARYRQAIIQYKKER